MTKSNKPTVKLRVSKHRDLEHFTLRNRDGTTERVITSSTTVRAVKSAAKTYRRALKELADE
jgi:hypothetical protein